MQRAFGQPYPFNHERIIMMMFPHGIMKTPLLNMIEPHARL